jgi:hypothetical protein
MQFSTIREEYTQPISFLTVTTIQMHDFLTCVDTYD